MFHPRIRAAAKPIITNTPPRLRALTSRAEIYVRRQRRIAQQELVLHRQAGLRMRLTQREGKSPVLPKHRTISPGDGAFLRSAKIFTARVLLRFPRQLLFHLLPPHGLPTLYRAGFFAHLPFSKQLFRGHPVNLPEKVDETKNGKRQQRN